MRRAVSVREIFLCSKTMEKIPAAVNAATKITTEDLHCHYSSLKLLVTAATQNTISYHYNASFTNRIYCQCLASALVAHLALTRSCAARLQEDLIILARVNLSVTAQSWITDIQRHVIVKIKQPAHNHTDHQNSFLFLKLSRQLFYLSIMSSL